ncbi:efflux RND transporter periplasmic adaptor subunit [Thalassoglobus polymorphus]|uniref:Cation efflux system protein CusB n=1 Tax=Thalassoglobus polymorphus TaxID=2527994 RepID=A0A517QKV8_9PLAN|nr:efflux RND transporter periplasmic adaptor subunit [Thalassoglobus polymorphus]QDT32231.1 Cation efflux system protein CusB precursor [Thalassoglobus polymorphus]
MTQPNPKSKQASETPKSTGLEDQIVDAQKQRVDSRRWWLKLFLQPLLLLACAAVTIAGLGLAQKTGWITSGSGGTGGVTGPAAADVDYICPMMCTPPQKEPGRCPVCAMELVPASTGGDGGDERSVIVDPASRRVANIQTVAARSVAMTRIIRAVGELNYDEGTLRTISAYSDGRFEQLYVDYTGAVVKKGDRLASLYSPELYSSQIEYLEAAKSANRETPKSLLSVADANRRMQENSHQRLIELGMAEQQIEKLIQSRTAQSRLDILAPMSGTVIEKIAVEGEYVKRGQPAFRLADLSSVWLMLELFPEDAADIRYGQAVEAVMKSLPDKTFMGRVAFIAPEVDPESRTVSVRVVIDNTNGILRIGDYAKATIEVPVGQAHDRAMIYDPELANKWVSPRHPHIVSDQPGKCRLCNMDLVPASELGFTDQPQEASKAITIPRNAVLMAAGQCVVYVETQAGRFEIRRVIVGSSSRGEIAILKGLADGEVVATKGNFLLDSQMQLAGNPSLIDPTRATEPMDMVPGFDPIMIAEIRRLAEADQKVALTQIICPITDFKLGSMGVPQKVMVNDKAVFICCEGCREGLLEEPELHLEKLRSHQDSPQPEASPENHSFPPVPPLGGTPSLTPDGAQPPIGGMTIISPDSRKSGVSEERLAAPDHKAERFQ